VDGSILEIVVASHSSSQTTSARPGVGRQSYSTKEGNHTHSYGAGFRREPGKPAFVPATGGSEQPASKKTLTSVRISGRLGRDAVVRHTKTGRLVANFSVAVNESFRDLLGEWQPKTTWHRVQVWEALAETVSDSLRKGARVYVEGRLALRNWIDGENRRHAYREIVASDVRFLDAASKCDTQNGSDSDPKLR